MAVIKYFKKNNGRSPFEKWFKGLSKPIRIRIAARVARMEDGNFGDHKMVGQSLFEARFFFGSGYRVYFGKDGNKIVVLLLGGNKSSQDKDIDTAAKYWEEYWEGKNE